MNEELFKKRTKQLAIRIIRVVKALPNDLVGQVIAKQLLRAGTSIGANYRAACRAKSTADMINKFKIVEEEADETLYWLELLIEAEILTVASLKTLRKKQKKS
ncbi:MAG: four helix bundle protein [Anaerolineaceae bacterium 4572_5.2]|nr:MAG: four helix bundle protein [Anaerolineaceae bacterium 4572_5.2]